MSSQRFLLPESDPEIIVAMVAPLGAPLGLIENNVKEILKKFGYESETIKISKLIESLVTAKDRDESKYRDSGYYRYDWKMSAGTQLRKKCGGDFLGCMACAEISSRRPTTDPKIIDKKAFIINQLKHPDEVTLLRKVYGTAFHLIGVSAPESARFNQLRSSQSLSEEEATKLIKRDFKEEQDVLGQ